jgi:ATP-dependent DNA helicase RecG
VYSDINYIPTKWTIGKIKLLQKYIDSYTEFLPEEILKKYNFISKKEAIYKIHFPKNMHDVEVAKYRLAYEELYEINYGAISKKHESFAHSEGKSIAIELDAEFIKEILKKLPFELTNHQKIVLFQTLKDMEKSHAMQRLVEGDVGTGKTIVALISAIHAILKSDSRVQVAIMAPTEILARQHFNGMQNMLFEFGISSDLLV